MALVFKTETKVCAGCYEEIGEMAPYIQRRPMDTPPGPAFHDAYCSGRYDGREQVGASPDPPKGAQE